MNQAANEEFASEISRMIEAVREMRSQHKMELENKNAEIDRVREATFFAAYYAGQIDHAADLTDPKGAYDMYLRIIEPRGISPQDMQNAAGPL